MHPRGIAAVLATILAPAWTWAAEPLRMREDFVAGSQYHVSIREEATGELRLPGETGKPSPPPIKIRGRGAQEYDERVLKPGAGDNPAPNTYRIYRRIELERTMDDQVQDSTLRPNVRRLVILRSGHREVPFSLDGPLTWGEVLLVTKDVFTPALACSLLPDRPVSPGDRWIAKPGAAQELTDLEQIEGTLECRFEEVTPLGGRRLARVHFSGSIRGISDDGPSRQKLDGYYYFDLESSHLSYLTLKGVHSLLDKTGQEVGRVEGQFTLTRQARTRCPELSDESIRGLSFEPNAENSLLLYESAELGVRLLHPRRWRAQSNNGRQLFFDEANGNGLMITMESPSTVPTAAAYLAETKNFLLKEKGKILNVQGPTRLQGPPEEIDQFGLDVEISNRKERLDYYIIRSANGGAIVAARLATGKQLSEMQRDAERIARSVRVFAPPAPPKPVAVPPPPGK